MKVAYTSTDDLIHGECKCCRDRDTNAPVAHTCLPLRGLLSIKCEVLAMHARWRHAVASQRVPISQARLKMVM
jgi:hypothetical protein